MALLNKIRERSGLAVGIIAFGLILFLLGAEFLNPASSFFNSNDVGEIDGVTVQPQAYDRVREEQDRLFFYQYNRRPNNDSESERIRQQAWLKLITDIAFDSQYDQLGVEVTDDETFDMTQGNNVSATAQSYFRNPQTGQYDPSFVRRYFSDYRSLPADERLRWETIERLMVDGRQRVKYENLLIASTYVPYAAAKRDYEQKNAVAEARYVYIPFYSVADSTISVSDSELKAYYNANKDKYTVDKESRSISYVRFPLHASAQDSTDLKGDLQSLTEDFTSADNDSVFARRNADSRVNYFGAYSRANLPQAFADDESKLYEGSVVGPMLEGNSFVTYKVSAIAQDTNAVAKARHILIRNETNDDAGKDAAREQAADLIRQLRNGADFAELAAEFGTDGTAQTGGDLGWFTQTQMVEPFANAVFDRGRTGLVTEPVETQFGYHVIEVTGAPDYTQFKIARIDREILASTTTENNAYRAADALRANAGGNLSGLENAAVAAGVQVLPLDNIDGNARGIGNMSNARPVVQWLFRDAEEGDVGDRIFEVDGAYLVVAMSGIQEAGPMDFEKVRSQIELEVRKEKKAEAIVAALGDVKSSTIDDIAANYGPDASIYTSNNLRASSNSVANIGFAPSAMGAVFGLEEGEISAPIVEANGVVVMQLEALIAATEQQSYEGNRVALQNQRRAANSGSIARAIEDQANIEDRRYRVE